MLEKKIKELCGLRYREKNIIIGIEMKKGI